MTKCVLKFLLEKYPTTYSAHVLKLANYLVYLRKKSSCQCLSSVPKILGQKGSNLRLHCFPINVLLKHISTHIAGYAAPGGPKLTDLVGCIRNFRWEIIVSMLLRSLLRYSEICLKITLLPKKCPRKTHFNTKCGLRCSWGA